MEGNDSDSDGVSPAEPPAPLHAVSAPSDGASTVPPSTPPASQAPGADQLLERMGKLERANGRMRWGMALALVAVFALGMNAFFPAATIVKQTLMESKEVKLVDNTGATRLFLRMYSRVPVLQLLDTNGKPRMSLGLRFDDTPFMDLSDKTGRTRATFEMTQDDEPTLKLFNSEGEVSFAIN
jgi:hypothetical protein